MPGTPHIEIAAEQLFSFLGMPITNTLLSSWLVMAILIVLALVIKKGVNLVPSSVQNAFELLIEGMVGLMEGVFGSREKTEKYLPIVATIFFFVLFSNWLGLLPGVGSIEFRSVAHGGTILVPLMRSGASDLNFTLALAIVTVVLVNILGVGAIGAGRHLSKFFSFKNPIQFFIGILELISEFAKMISFSFRLFGNIFAGEVLLVIIAFLAPYVVPVPFLMLEVFVGLIQAVVFAMLAMVFIGIAVVEHH